MKNLLMLLLVLSAGIAHAQVVTTIGKGDDLFQKNLYSADRVMEMRNELDLTETQAAKIKKIHSENAGKFSTMKWDLDDETKKLKALMDQSKIDETAVQKQMDKVLALENSMKKQQLSTMVSIKNELSPEQQEILQKNAVFVVKGFGYSNDTKNTTSFSNVEKVKVVKGYPNATGSTFTWNSDKVASASGTHTPKVEVMVAGVDKNDPPLYYIENDGEMKEVKDLKSIQPENIASIEVLKDKSATDIFGEKGKNGVIIVKLKKDPKK